jgi:hypothetical protein
VWGEQEAEITDAIDAQNGSPPSNVWLHRLRAVPRLCPEKRRKAAKPEGHPAESGAHLA